MILVPAFYSKKYRQHTTSTAIADSRTRATANDLVAGSDSPIFELTLVQRVLGIITMDVLGRAGGAQIKVATIADRAVVMGLPYADAAVVAIDGKRESRLLHRRGQEVSRCASRGEVGSALLKSNQIRNGRGLLNMLLDLIADSVAEDGGECSTGAIAVDSLYHSIVDLCGIASNSGDRRHGWHTGKGRDWW